jgi:hypothetical protein
MRSSAGIDFVPYDMAAALLMGTFIFVPSALPAARSGTRSA